VTGLLFVDKSAGITSHDVVSVTRRAARTRRVGHAGTLDPFATGLLVVAVGSCTRLLPYLAGEPKVYEATIRFGVATDTDDRTGRVIHTEAVPAIDQSRLTDALAGLTGAIMQVPPSYSAKHVDGQRAYDLARRGRDVPLAPVSVVVHTWEVLAMDGADLAVRITCGGGTYVRALARDLGRALGTVAHCAALRRIASGAATVERAVPMDALRPGAIADGTVALISPLALLTSMAHETLDATALTALSHGRAVPATRPGERAALLHEGVIVGIGDRVHDERGDRWQPRLVLTGNAA
jgi:tRNA pseudouridine55 synthase